MLNKLTLVITTFLVVSGLIAQKEFNQWSVGVEGGHHGAMTAATTNLKVPNLGYVSLNTRYMANPRFGMMLRAGYNGFKFEESDDVINRVNYLNFTLEGVANLGQIMNFSSWTNHIGLLLHTGPGGAINGIGSDTLNTDKMLVGRLGLSPIFKLGNKFMLSTDLTFNGHLKQGVTFDRYESNEINGNGVDGYFFTASVGLTYYIGKAEKHADWTFPKKIDVDGYERRIAELETSLGNALKDDDNDGVPNSFDDDNNTPEGVKVNSKGVEIADIDKDGIPDELDACPEMAGTFSTNGCPDSDKDGVADKDDKCPEKAGAMYNNGCPDIKKETKVAEVNEKINLESINFAVGTPTINAESFSKLENVVKVMNENKDYKLNINGYADDMGPDDFNMSLSQKRANTVKAYLVSKGLDANRLVAKGFGESQPVASNSNEKGRSMNRRVEFKIFF